MSETRNPRQQLRHLLQAQSPVVAPGAFECVTARLIEQAGYSAVYMTGAGTAATNGYPDYGLVTMSEMVANAGRIADTVSVPLIADADTGYGNELNVTRAIREYESRGVAAVHIEDQGFPKKCGHLDDKEIIPLEAYTAKIRAAAAARLDPDFVIIARTDSRAVLGFDEAITRANAALDAGADIAFVEAPLSMQEVEAIPRRVHGPCLLNLVNHGKTPLVSFEEAGRMGFKIAILPGLLLSAAMSACQAALEATKAAGAYTELDKGLTVHEMFGRMGAAEWDALRGDSARTGREAAE